MNYRKGLMRVAIALFALFEIAALSGLAFLLWRAWSNPFYATQGGFSDYQLNLIAPWAIAAIAGPIIFAAAAWAIRGFNSN